MKSYRNCLVVLFISLGISPQDTSTTTLRSNEYTNYDGGRGFS